MVQNPVLRFKTDSPRLPPPGPGHVRPIPSSLRAISTSREPRAKALDGHSRHLHQKKFSSTHYNLGRGGAQSAAGLLHGPTIDTGSGICHVVPAMTFGFDEGATSEMRGFVQSRSIGSIMIPARTSHSSAKIREASRPSQRPKFHPSSNQGINSARPSTVQLSQLNNQESTSCTQNYCIHANKSAGAWSFC